MDTLNLSRVFTIVAGILTIPAIAMFVTTQVNWSFVDFIVMGLLLTFSGLLIEWVRIKFNSRTLRVASYCLILFAVLLLWLELAVGIFDSPLAGA